jgi:hypothetical protein
MQHENIGKYSKIEELTVILKLSIACLFNKRTPFIYQLIEHF